MIDDILNLHGIYDNCIIKIDLYTLKIELDRIKKHLTYVSDYIKQTNDPVLRELIIVWYNKTNEKYLGKYRFYKFSNNLHKAGSLQLI